MNKFIRHITLTTGHARDSFPGEVSPEAIAACRQIIDQIIGGTISEPASIPGTGCHITGRASSKCLLATVWYRGEQRPLCTIAVAAHSRCGAKLWRDLHTWGETSVVTDPDRCPPEPWVAAALYSGIESHMEAAHWLGDFERCLAWAWLAKIEESTG